MSHLQMSSGKNNVYEKYATYNEEKEAADNFEYYPQPPVKIENVDIDIKDEFNGEVNINLTNGDHIQFKIKEKVSRLGADYDAHILINSKQYEIDLDEFFQNGTYVDDLMKFYINNNFFFKQKQKIQENQNNSLKDYTDYLYEKGYVTKNNIFIEYLYHNILENQKQNIQIKKLKSLKDYTDYLYEKGYLTKNNVLYEYYK